MSMCFCLKESPLSHLTLFFCSDGSLSQLEHVNQPAVSEESAHESIKDDYSTLPSNLPLPVMQDAEAHCSVQANTQTPMEQTNGMESPVATSTSCPNGEDAQVQTDDTPPIVPPEKPIERVPSSANVPEFEIAEKKDMATSSEEVDLPDLKYALSHTSETSSSQDSTPSAPVTAKAQSIYATNSEPKPKPSNELTRDYIPKVGMTTYTIVPQKSLEKLRYFEVALTLERPLAAGEEGLNMGSLHLEESTAPREQSEVSKEESELYSTVPRENLLTSITTTIRDTVNGNIPESIHSSSAASFSKADEASQAGSPAEVKEVKIPPATKPKPSSFRLAQHKKTPGYYVTSAAEKRHSASPGSGQREAQASAEGAQLPFPPPPPPVQFEEDTAGASNVQLSPKGDDKNVAVMRISRQSSLPSKHPSTGLSLEKLRSFAAPRPYTPVTPSRFAQAVSSAVKRSQSLSHAPTSPRSPLRAPLSPITSHPSVVDSTGLSKPKVSSDSTAYFCYLLIRLPTLFLYLFFFIFF